ncbi:MAG TPA: hypothetical protein VNP03_01115, partial [Pseudonocardia sp.]|nr:hypothetical protein [Pseudonocardia sp.]
MTFVKEHAPLQYARRLASNGYPAGRRTFPDPPRWTTVGRHAPRDLGGGELTPADSSDRWFEV